MFRWIYEISSLLAIAAFGTAFVGICWLGIFFTRPLVRNWFH